jgi:hypothetical protein
MGANLNRLKRNCGLALAIGSGLFFGFIGTAQKFSVGDAISLKGTGFDPNTKTIFAIWSDSIRAYYGPNYNHSKLFAFTRPVADFPESFNIVWSKNALNFVDNHGGAVFQFKNDKLIKVDSSYEHKMQMGSSIFSKNDTVFRYGGYGFWSYRNFFTFFNENSGSWDLIEPTGSSEFPEGTSDSQILQQGDSIILIGGAGLDFKDPLVSKSYPYVWMFQLKSRKWKFLGTTDWENIQYYPRILMGNKLLFLPNRNLAIVADPINNTFYRYRINPELSELFVSLSPWENRFSSFYSDGRFYLLKLENESRSAVGVISGSVVYEIISEEQLLAKELGSGPFYISSEADSFSVWYFFLSLALLSGGLLIWFNRKSSNTVILAGTELKRGNQAISLPEELSIVLKNLINNGGEISFSEFEKLIKNSELSKVERTDHVFLKIAELNLTIKTFLKIDRDPVFIARSSTDRRSRSVKINVSPLKLIINE